MKIIGGRDYYDGAGYGVDETIVFLRKEENLINSPLYPKRPMTFKGDDSGLYFHYVLIGGEVYPAVRIFSKGHYLEKRNQFGKKVYVPSREEWFYTEEESQKALTETDLRSYSQRHTRRQKELYAGHISRHFAKTEDPAWTNWMIENRAITGIISWKNAGYRKKSNTARINIDGLKDIGFYRAIDPSTAHMRIANFIGGVLPGGVETVEIGNTDRIRKAGFDTKTSFRKAPGQKKRRKINN